MVPVVNMSVGVRVSIQSRPGKVVSIYRVDDYHIATVLYDDGDVEEFIDQIWIDPVPDSNPNRWSRVAS